MLKLFTLGNTGKVKYLLKFHFIKHINHSQNKIWESRKIDNWTIFNSYHTIT